MKTYLPLLLSLLAVDLLAAISPGPNFVVVAQAAIRGSFRQAATVVTGILMANLLWCLGVVLGLSALFDLAPWLYGTMKVLGGTYLIYLGVTLWRTGNRPVLVFWRASAAQVRCSREANQPYDGRGDDRLRRPLARGS